MSLLSKSRICLFFGVLGLSGALVNHALGAGLKVLPGYVPREISNLKAIARLPSTNQIRLAIGVPLHDSAGLAKFLAQLYDPSSTNFQHYLAPDEFTSRFGPTEQEYDAVKQFALTNGLTILQTHGNRLVLDVAGPVAAVEKALHIRLQTYQHPTEPRHFFAPDTEPSVAADLPVADIQGLSDFRKPHPRLRKMDASKIRFKGGSAPDGSGSYFGNDFRNAYVPGTALTGTGQTVGLLEFDGYYASDITAYATAAGGGRNKITVQSVLLDGFDGVPTTGPNSGDGEVSLDIEMAMAMAPGLAGIKVYEAGPNGLQNDVLSTMAADSSVKCLACCWGWNGGPSTTTDNIFQQMAAQGQSFFNATGDSDAFTVGVNSANAVDDPNSGNAPSSSPYVTQVGGTTLAMNGTGASYRSETVWNWGRGSGSSGGVSSYYTIPGWQTGISMTSNLGSTTQRNIPDVALVADNVCVYDSRGSIDVFGGTSCSAPLWAGLIALVNQQAASHGHAPAGFINPAIYAIGKGQNSSYSYAACFHDTTTGNNFWSASPNKYSAVKGYDLCTGWGTPAGMNLINALSGATSGVANSNGVVSISPASGFSFNGPRGGPFHPTLGTFHLINTSTSAQRWSLVSTSVWLRVASSNGTLAARSSKNVAVNIATAASALKAGTYSTFLAFVSGTSRVTQEIPVTLQITSSSSATLPHSPMHAMVALAGLDAVASTPAASVAPFKAVLKKTRDFQLAWKTESNSVYQLQYKTNISQVDWINLGDAITSRTNTLTTTDTNAWQSSPQRFYRLLKLR